MSFSATDSGGLSRLVRFIALSRNENSHYQYERGLFTPEVFEPRVERWRVNMSNPGFRGYRERSRQTYAPSLRAEIDRIVSEGGN
jgi:hypothetical protein